MKSARIFNCALCHCQVIICSCCDRGNIYCGDCCAKKARRKSLLAAGIRYQNTFRGKVNHAKRQQHYREYQKYQKNIVTHHGSIPPVLNALLPFEDHKLKNLDKNKKLYCHFCGCTCDFLLRTDFLKTSTSNYWPLGP